jgi:Flp pilus assembly protein TadG
VPGRRDPGFVNERGSTVVEVVVIVPVIMVLIVTAIQMALWADAAEVVQASAAVGSEIAAGTGGSLQAGTQVAESYLAEHGADVTDASVRSGTSNGFVEVRVRAMSVAIVPFMHFEVSADRIEPIQEFRESG